MTHVVFHVNAFLDSIGNSFLVIVVERMAFDLVTLVTLNLKKEFVVEVRSFQMALVTFENSEEVVDLA